MALLSTQLVTCVGVAVTTTAAAAAGDTCQPAPAQWLEVTNGSGSTVTVTVSGVDADVEVAVPASGTRYIGPLDTESVDTPSGLISWTYSAHEDVTVAVVAIDPLGSSATASPYVTHRATLGGDDLRAEGPRNTAGAPMLIWCHEGGGDVDSPWRYVNIPGYPLWTDIWSRLLDDGWIIASSDLAGVNMGNAASRTAVDTLIEWADTLWTVTDIVLVGCSMGGLTSANYIADGGYDARVRGLIGTGAVYDLAAVYALPTTGGFDFKAAIRTAYGFSDDAGYAAATSGHDPILRTATLYDDLRYRFYGSAADTLAPLATHGAAMSTHILTGDPTESTVVTGSGAHIGAGFYPDPPAYGWDDPDDWLEFLAACIA